MFPPTVVAVHHCMTELVTYRAGDKHSSTFPFVGTVSLTQQRTGLQLMQPLYNEGLKANQQLNNGKLSQLWGGSKHFMPK